MTATEPMALLDRDSRDRIRDDLDRNLFVEAGAGTGKTRVLVDRVVRLVATGTVRDAANLVAITFTEAAAAELRDRIRRALELAAAGAQLPAAERERCETARRRLDTATITTLHGFAYRILAEHALEAGLPPAFEVDDEVRAGVSFVERWRRFRDELFADPSLERDLLFAHALQLQTGGLRGLARLLHDRWDRLVGVEFPVPELPDVDVAPILAAIDEAVEVAGDRLEVEDRLVDVVRAWQERGNWLRDAAEAGDEIEVLRVLDHWKPRKPGNYGRAELWGSAKPVVIGAINAALDETAELLGAVRTALVQRLLPRLQAFTLDGADQRRRQGRIEYHDLLVYARDLLHANTAVRVALAERIDVVLIDEFQDTDPLQVDIAFALAADDPHVPPPPWEDVLLRPGKLLVVGDPKQSIYGFRGADISLWDRTRRLFPGGVERLEQNFRTVPPLLEWVNRVFATVIADGVEGAQPRYEKLAPFRPDVRDEPAVVVVGSCVADARAPDLREREAADLARLIASMKVDRWTVVDEHAGGERPARFDDIAVLVPTRTPLRQIERALDQLDIPYRIESRSLVWATDAVRELLAVLAAIDDPGDEVAVVAALRSPGFACSDADLLDWKLAGGRWDHRRPKPDPVPDGHPVAQAMAALAAYHAIRDELAVNELVERIIRERRLVELTFVQRRPRDHWRRLRFVLDQARAFVEAGGSSLAAFVAWARLQADEQATVIETPAPEPDDDAVRILTIHGSKGLEFPIVVLAGLSSKPNASGPSVLFGPDRPEVAVGNRERRFTTPGYAELAGAASEADDHEAKRLLYVAATRARDHLAISLYHGDKGQLAQSHAAALWKVCHEAAAGWWRPAMIGGQLVLPVDEPAPPFTPRSAAERAAWIDEHDAIVARANRRRVWAASGLGEPLEAAGDLDGGTDRPDRGRMARRGGRGGTALGRAVHAVLQSVDLDDPSGLRDLAVLHATAEGIASAADDVERRARAALDAPVLRAARARPAAKRWRELYVAAPIGDGGRLLEGYLDLLYEDGNGDLVLVDYKTDADLDASAARYRLQAAAYALAVGAVIGPVARAVLVHCRAGGADEHEVADLAAAIDEVRVMVAGG